MLNQHQIRHLSYATILELEAVTTGRQGLICFCDETETFYSFVSSGAGYLVDDTCILSTGSAGNTRWVGFAGKYVNKQGTDVIAATNMTLPNNGSSHIVTGVTGIELINSAQLPYGTVITLRFQGILTVTNNAAASTTFYPIVLKSGANYTTVADDILVLELWSDNTWRELGNLSITSAGSFIEPLPMPITVGGYPVGTTFPTLQTVQAMFEGLLYPELNPTLTPPSNTFALTQAGLREIGEASLTLNFTATFNQGSINPQYTATSPLRSGLPNTYTYTGTGITSPVSSSSLTDSETVLNYTVVSGVQSWTNTVTYDASTVQPYTSKNNAYDVPLIAGTTSAKTVSITGVYPVFATTVIVTTMTKQALALMNSIYIQTNMVAEDDLGNKQKAEFPTGWSAITGIQFFNTVSNAWEWLNGVKANSLNTFTSSAVTETIQGNVINYTRYSHNGSKIGARLRRWYTN